MIVGRGSQIVLTGLLLVALEGCCGTCGDICTGDEVWVDGACTPCPTGTTAREKEKTSQGRTRSLTTKWRWCEDSDGKLEGPYNIRRNHDLFSWGHTRQGKRVGPWVLGEAPSGWFTTRYDDGQLHGLDTRFKGDERGSQKGAERITVVCYYRGEKIWTPTAPEIADKWVCPAEPGTEKTSGKVKRDFAKGARATRGQWKRGVPEGEWRWWDKEGQLKAKVTFETGALTECLACGSGFRQSGSPKLSKRAREMDLGRAREKCDEGEAQACDVLGARLFLGVGVERDHEAARKSFKKACEGKVADACYDLAVMHKKGEGGKRNLDKALPLAARGCKLDSMRSCDFEGKLILAQDDKAPKDYERARERFEKACDKHYARSCVALGDMLEAGRGIEKDEDEAIKRYQKACLSGNNDACSKRDALKRRIQDRERSSDD